MKTCLVCYNSLENKNSYFPALNLTWALRPFRQSVHFSVQFQFIWQLSMGKQKNERETEIDTELWLDGFASILCISY